MADLIVSGFDDSTGQKKQAEAGDTLVDRDGNPISLGQSTTLLGSATSINLTTPGATSLYTVPAGSDCIVTDAYIRLTAVSAFTSHGQYEIRNSANTRTFLSNQTPPTNLNTVDEMWSFTRTIALAYFDLAQPSDVIEFNILSSATATTLTATVYLFGILV